MKFKKIIEKIGFDKKRKKRADNNAPELSLGVGKNNNNNKSNHIFSAHSKMKTNKSLLSFILLIRLKIKSSEFLKDAFIWAMVILGALINMAFLYYIRAKVGGNGGSQDGALFGQDDASSGPWTYNVPAFIAMLSIANIVIARLAYKYDILAAYVLVISVPIFNAFYLASAFLFLSA